MNDLDSSNVIDELTAAEMSIAERTAGLSVATLEDPNFPKVDMLGALAWVYQKRSNPTLTFKEFMDSNTITSITTILGLNGEEDATPRVDAVAPDAEGGS